MPQPIPHHRVATTESKTLTPEQKAAIGDVAIQWSHAEMALALCMSKFSGAKLEAALIALGNMTSKSKIDTVGAIASDALTSKQHIEFLKLLKTARMLSGKRNALVHAAWIGNDKLGRAVCLKLEGRFEGASVEYAGWTTKEMEEVAANLHKLFNDLNLFLIHHGMWNGKLFE